MTRAATAARDGVWALRDTAVSLGAAGRRIRRSLTERPHPSHFDGRRFRNIEPASQLTLQTLATVARALTDRSGTRRPTRPVPLARPEFPAAAADLAATWLGHATVLIEVDGLFVLADPMLGHRASPAAFTGPGRLHPAPLAVEQLPNLDAIVISHDHYDHLDRGTVEKLTAHGTAPLLVPLGIGAHLRAWGVPPSRIVELDWGGQHRIGELTITCTPARHFSGRSLARNTTLWSSWTLTGPRHRVFFGGDTGYTAAFTAISRQHGPFDLTVLPIGAYADAWPDVHMTPEQAVRAHRDLSGAVLLPIHWATFDLAPHPWAEPIERLLKAAAGDMVLTPRPGERIADLRRGDPDPESGGPERPGPWWR